MATISKTDSVSVLALQSVAASSVLISGVLDVATKLAVTIFIHFGRRAVTAAGAGVNFRVEASSKPTGNGHWYPLAIFTTDFVACEAEAVSGTEAAGSTIIEVASTANLTAQDIVFFDNATMENGEWARLKSVVGNTSVTLEDAITNAQTGSTIYDRAEMYSPQLDVSAVKRLRVVADGSLFTQAFAVEVHAVYGDSIG